MRRLALVYSLLGLLAGLTGTLFGAVSSNPWAYFLMANLLLVFGLAMLDVFTVNAPARLAGLGRRGSRETPRGVFLMGAASGLVAAPCGAPAFAAVLTFVAATGSAGARVPLPAGLLAGPDRAAGGRRTLQRHPRGAAASRAAGPCGSSGPAAC